MLKTSPGVCKPLHTWVLTESTLSSIAPNAGLISLVNLNPRDARFWDKSLLLQLETSSCRNSTHSCTQGAGVDVCLLKPQFSVQRVLDEVTLWCWQSSLGFMVNLLLHNILYSAQRCKDAWRHHNFPKSCGGATIQKISLESVVAPGDL